MDRQWMAACPEGRCSMHHQWRDLLFLHWEVPAEDLQKLIPEELTVDTFDGKAYIALVPFRILNIRAEGFVPVPGFCQFLEINVRTYVHDRGKNPGVWFFSLDAANAAACFGARLSYKLPYYYASMSQVNEAVGAGTRFTYQSKRRYPGPKPANAEIEYTVGDGPETAALPGTLDHFFVERYLLYSKFGGRIFVGQVHHTPYPLVQTAVSRFNESLIKAAGIFRPDLAPIVQFSRGVDVQVFPLKPV